jgi:hypothetical protein
MMGGVVGVVFREDHGMHDVELSPVVLCDPHGVKKSLVGAAGEVGGEEDLPDSQHDRLSRWSHTEGGLPPIETIQRMVSRGGRGKWRIPLTPSGRPA